MYRTLKNKISNLQKMLDVSEVDNNPQIVLVVMQEDKTYQIIETYYNKKTSKYKRVEFNTDDYKRALEKYTSNTTRVIINDLI